MSDSRPDLSTPLSTVVIAMSVPEAILSRFRAEFPEIRFIVPSDGTADGDDRKLSAKRQRKTMSEMQTR